MNQGHPPTRYEFARTTALGQDATDPVATHSYELKLQASPTCRRLIKDRPNDVLLQLAHSLTIHHESRSPRS